MEEVVLGSKKASITIKVGDASYPVKKPKVGFQDDTQEALSDAVKNGKNAFPILLNWAEHVGIPASVVRQEFDLEDLQELFVLLSAPKKKPE